MYCTCAFVPEDDAIASKLVVPENKLVEGLQWSRSDIKRCFEEWGAVIECC
jgi:hypothetical protein